LILELRSPEPAKNKTLFSAVIVHSVHSKETFNYSTHAMSLLPRQQQVHQCGFQREQLLHFLFMVDFRQTFRIP